MLAFEGLRKDWEYMDEETEGKKLEPLHAPGSRQGDKPQLCM